MDQVRFGIIGIGTMGSNHAKWMEEGKIRGAVLSAVCDISPERVQWAQENLKETVAVFTDYKELIASGKVDAVLIATPHYFHPVIAVEALEAGLHTLVEKPAGVYTKAVEAMNETAARNPELVFGMMFNQRMNPLYQKIKEIMDSGRLGGLRRVTWIITTWWRPQKYYEQSSWRATWQGEGGGVLANQAPHQVDLLQWICGMPGKVRGYLRYGSHRNITVEDDVTAYMEFPNGGTGVFISCTHDVLGSGRLEILCDKGKIYVENSTKATVKVLEESETEMNARMDFEDAKRLVRGGKLKDICSEETFEFPDLWGIQHQQVTENFAGAILHKTPLVAPGSEGIRGLTLANAMYLSDWLGKEVEIPFDGDLFLDELHKKIEEETK